MYCVTQKKNTKSIAVPQISSRTGKQWRNERSTELYWLFIAADSIDDALSGALFSEANFNELFPNPDQVGFYIVKSGRILNNIKVSININNININHITIN